LLRISSFVSLKFFSKINSPVPSKIDGTPTETLFSSSSAEATLHFPLSGMIDLVAVISKRDYQ